MESSFSVDPLQLFDEDIFKLLGIPDISPSEKEQLMERMQKNIQQRVFANILLGLDEEETIQWNHLLGQHNFEKITAFILQKGINLQKISLEEALIYKTELVALVSTKITAL